MGRIIMCGHLRAVLESLLPFFNLAYSLAETEKRFCVWILTARLISPPALE